MKMDSQAMAAKVACDRMSRLFMTHMFFKHTTSTRFIPKKSKDPHVRINPLASCVSPVNSTRANAAMMAASNRNIDGPEIAAKAIHGKKPRRMLNICFIRMNASVMECSPKCGN